MGWFYVIRASLYEKVKYRNVCRMQSNVYDITFCENIKHLDDSVLIRLWNSFNTFLVSIKAAVLPLEKENESPLFINKDKNLKRIRLLITNTTH